MIAKIKVFQKLPAFRRKLLQTENQCLLKQEALQIYYEHNYYIYNNHQYTDKFKSMYSQQIQTVL